MGLPNFEKINVKISIIIHLYRIIHELWAKNNPGIKLLRVDRKPHKG